MESLPDVIPANSMMEENLGKKRTYLSRTLAREKAVCPGCQKTLQVGTLAWAHKCKRPKQQPSDMVVHERLVKMVANATKKHEERMVNHTMGRSRSRSQPRRAHSDASDSSYSAASSPASRGTVDSASSADTFAPPTH